MRRAKLFFINAVMLSAVNILMRTVAVSFNAYVSNKIGAEGMGVLTLAMSVYGLAVTLACSGINLAALRLTVETVTARDMGIPSRFSVGGVIGACAVYSLIFGVATGAGLLGLSEYLAEAILGDIRTLPSLRALAVSLPAISLSSAIAGYFTGVRRVYKNVAVTVIEQFIKISVTSAGLVLIAPAGIEYACLAVVGGSAIAEAGSLVTSALLYLFDRGRRRASLVGIDTPKSDFRGGFRAVASISLPVAVAAYMRQGLATVENIMIPRALKMSGAGHAAALASYGTLCGMVMPLIMFPSAVMYAFAGLLVPEMSEYLERGETDKIRSVAGRVFRASLMFSIPVAGIFSSFSYDIGMSLYGSAEAARLICMIAPLIPVMYLDASVDGMLKGLGEQVYSMRVNILDAAVSLALVFVLVPKMGIDGYIWVIYICETMNAVLSIARLIKVTGMRADMLRWVGLPLGGILAAAGAVKLMSYYPLPILGMTAEPYIRLITVALLYVGMLFILGAVKKDDLAWLGRAVK